MGVLFLFSRPGSGFGIANIKRNCYVSAIFQQFQPFRYPNNEAHGRQVARNRRLCAMFGMRMDGIRAIGSLNYLLNVNATTRALNNVHTVFHSK